MNNFPADLIPIGKIIKPHGIKGEVKLKLYNEDSRILEKDFVVWIRDKNKDFKFFKIVCINYNPLNPIVKLEGVNDRNKVLDYLDFSIYISRSMFPKNKKDEIYFVDFIGCKVYNNKKLFVGIVKDFVHLPNNDLMIVDNEGEEFMIPINNDLIELFDFEKKHIIIDIIDGLLN